MMSISTMSIVGSVSTQADRLAAVVGRDDDHAVFVEHGGQREDVAHVVVDDQRLLAVQRLGARRARLRRHARSAVRHHGRAAMQQNAVCASSVSSDSRLAQARSRCGAAASCFRQQRRRVQHDRQLADAGAPLDRPRARPRGPRSAIESSITTQSASAAPRGARRVVDDEQFDLAVRASEERLAQLAASASTTTSFLARRARRSDAARPAPRRPRPSTCSGLARKPIAPACSARSRASSVETTQIGMWRVSASVFRRSRMRQPSMSGRWMSSVIADGWYSRAIVSAPAPVSLTRPLKPVAPAASSSTWRTRGRSRRSAARGRRLRCRRGRRRPRWRTAPRVSARHSAVPRRARQRRGAGRSGASARVLRPCGCRQPSPSRRRTGGRALRAGCSSAAGTA